MPRDPHRVEVSDRIRIQHMLDAAKQVQQFAEGRVRSDLDTDPMFARAVLHALQEIGEAASRVSEPSRTRIPALPWTQIVGMRHRLVHVYWSTNMDMVWEVVVRDIPVLITAIEEGVREWPLAP